MTSDNTPVPTVPPINLVDGPYDELPARRPGTIVVAIGSKGAIEIRDGAPLTWGERTFGGYKSFYLVKTSPASIVEEYRVGSSHPTLYFNVTVTYEIRITRAREIVDRGITDLSRLLSTPARRALSEVGRRHSMTEIAAAREDMQKAIDGLPIDAAAVVVEAAVDVRADDGALALLRQVHEADLKKAAIGAQSSVDELARSKIRPVLETPDEVLAQLLVTKDESFRQALQMRVEQAATQQERSMILMKALIDSKIIEPHDFHDRFPEFVNELFRSIPTRGPISKVLNVPDATPSITDQKRDAP
jgi:hypothetical protein